MSCPQISIIQSNECIGNSLTVINDNFTSLQEGICNNITRITDIENDISNLTTQLISLSALTTPGAARAWVNFNANRDINNVITPAGNRRIYGSYNVSNVQVGSETSRGQYTINFTNDLPNENYGVIATCSEAAATNGNYVWVHPGEKASNMLTIYIHSINANEIAKPSFVSVIII